jgi:hypothetical protein
MLQWLYTYVASVCSKCFICFFPTYVASVFILMLHMFHTYVASVLSGCCICLQLFFKCFYMCFRHMFRMFQPFCTYIAIILFGCFKSRSGCNMSHLPHLLGRRAWREWRGRGKRGGVARQARLCVQQAQAQALQQARTSRQGSVRTSRR